MKENNIKSTGIHFRQIIHNPLLGTMKLIRNYSLSTEGQIVHESAKPCIFVVNHSNVHDVPTVSEIVNEHFYLLAGDEVKNDLSGFLFNLNGVVWVDRKDKKSMNISKEKLIELLNKGVNILLFPEGTWNRTEKIMLPLHWGVIDIAKITGCPIVPVVMEYSLDNYPECYSKIGEPIIIGNNYEINGEMQPEIMTDNEKKSNAIEFVRDSMASLRWYIWEEIYNDNKRVSKKEFEAYMKNTIDEYPKLDVKLEESFIYKPYDDEDDVFNPLEKNIVYTKNNAFLLRGQRHRYNKVYNQNSARN